MGTVKHFWKYWRENINSAKEGHEMLVLVIFLVWKGAYFTAKYIGIEFIEDASHSELFEKIDNLTGWLFFICALLWLPFKRHAAEAEKHTAAEKVRLSIEDVRCQWEINERCICCVGIQNHSQAGTAENVSVRIEGNIPEELGYDPGFNPFHSADLTPSAGHRSINPGAMADFQFPEAVNALVFALPVIGGRLKGKRVTFKLIASSNASAL